MKSLICAAWFGILFLNKESKRAWVVFAVTHVLLDQQCQPWIITSRPPLVMHIRETNDSHFYVFKSTPKSWMTLSWRNALQEAVMVLLKNKSSWRLYFLKPWTCNDIIRQKMLIEWRPRYACFACIQKYFLFSFCHVCRYVHIYTCVIMQKKD